MAGSSWKNIGCGGSPDEWTCVKNLRQEVADPKFQNHWDTWITQEDIKKIKTYGLNTIRVPVGFWMIESLVDRKQEHYPQGGLTYLDRLVGWAAEAGLYVIIDLHGAPGSQAPNEPFTGRVCTAVYVVPSSELTIARASTQPDSSRHRILNEPINSSKRWPNESILMTSTAQSASSRYSTSHLELRGKQDT